MNPAPISYRLEDGTPIYSLTGSCEEWGIAEWAAWHHNCSALGINPLDVPIQGDQE